MKSPKGTPLVRAALCCATLFILAQPLLAQTPSAPECKRLDDRFTEMFDLWAIVLGPFLLCVISPLFVPRALNFRYWWLTKPFQRWLILTGIGSSFLMSAYVLLPWLTINQWIPSWLGVASYWDVDESYLRCLQSNINARGLLWSLMGGGRVPALLRPSVMSYLLAAAVGIWAVVYWAIFRIAKTKLGLASRI